MIKFKVIITTNGTLEVFYFIKTVLCFGRWVKYCTSSKETLVISDIYKDVYGKLKSD
jgi:hypothetical protein